VASNEKSIGFLPGRNRRCRESSVLPVFLFHLKNDIRRCMVLNRKKIGTAGRLYGDRNDAVIIAYKKSNNYIFTKI
jgi:hypothetical protein